MLCVLEVLGCMFVLRRITAAYLSTFQAQPQMDPCIPCFDAIFANMFVRVCNFDLVEMCTLHRRSPHSPQRSHLINPLDFLLTPSAGPAYNSARARCTKCTEIAPSPTAEATRFTLPDRTSPTAKTPGRLVSSICGARASGQA